MHWCKKIFGSKTEVVPSSLPKDRVSNSKIFQVVGVDLASPLHLKDRPMFLQEIETSDVTDIDCLDHQEINKRIRHVQTIREQLRKDLEIGVPRPTQRANAASP
ncbi:hypothetical protein TNCV_4154091 [Trichonephila clavipes]|nr:hypothetical protein TNCV_4154091 [Trichonephila clavipes]